MPPLDEEHTIRLNVDTSKAERELGNMARRISHQVESQLVRMGQLAAFGLAGYGALRFFTSPTGMHGLDLAHRAYSNIQGSLGFSPVGERMQPGGLVYTGWSSALIGEPLGYTGRNLDPSIAGYYGARDWAQRVGAGTVGFMTGTGLALGVLGGGALLNRLGVGPYVTSASAALGRVAGGSLMGGATNLAGRFIATPLRFIGLGRAANAVMAGTNFIAAGATQAGRFLGGFVGGFMPFTLASMAVGRIGEEIALNIATQRQIEDMIDQMSFRYTFGNASNIAAGRGFGARDQAEIASLIRRTLINEEFMRQTDFSEILQGITTSQLDFNVRSAREFQEKFTKVVSSLKEIARTFETSLQGAVELLGDMQRSGFYTTADQVSALFRANALARYSGMRGEQMIQIGLTGAELARNYGFEGRFGASLQTSLAAMVAMRPDFINPAERDRYMELVRELGGTEAVAAQITDFFMRQARTNEFIPIALYGLADVQRGTLNEAALSQFMAGEMNFSELIRRGQERIARNQREYERFLNESDRYFAMLSGAEATQFFRGFLTRLQRDFGAQDIRTVLASMGMDNQMLRYVTEQTLFGRPMTSEGVMQAAEIQRLAMGEARLYRTPRGLFERYVGTPFERFFATLSNPFVQGYDAWVQGVEDFYNRVFLRAGTVRLNERDFSIDSILAGENLLRIGEHQARVLDLQNQIIGALQQIEAHPEMAQAVLLRREAEELRHSLEDLFSAFNQGRMSIGEFVAEYDKLVNGIQSIANAAQSSGEAMRRISEEMVRAFNELRMDEAGLISIAEMGGAVFGAPELSRGVERARVSQAVRLAMTVDRTLSAQAQNALEELTMRGGLITQQIFMEATQGLTQAERAEVAARLSQRAIDSGGALALEAGPYLEELYAVRSALGASVSRESDAVLAQAIAQTRGMRGAAGRRRFLEIALQNIEDPVVRETLQQFFGEYRDIGLIDRLMGRSSLDVSRLYDIMQQRNVSEPLRSRIQTLVGEMLSAMGQMGFVNLQDVRMDASEFSAVAEGIEQRIARFGDELDAATRGNLIGIGAQLSGSEYRRIMRDPTFIQAAKIALGSFGDPFARDIARGMLAGDERAQILLDAILARAQSQGQERARQDLAFFSDLETAQIIEGYAGISTLMRNRFSAIATGLREQARVQPQYADVLRRGAGRIETFLSSGRLLEGLEQLYNEDVIQAFRLGDYTDLAAALQLGFSYRQSGDRDAVLAQARRSGLFDDEILGRLSGATDKAQFQTLLDAAVGAILRSSAATTGENIVYGDQDPATIARLFSRQFESSPTMTQIRDTNRELITTMSTLSSTLNDLERTLRQIQNRLY